MDWIEFVSEHPGRLNFPRIGRSIYSGASHMQDLTSSTLAIWFRETERQLLSE